MNILQEQTLQAKDARYITEMIDEVGEKINIIFDSLRRSAVKYFDEDINEKLDVFFVKTGFYIEALKAMQEAGIVILVGMPGIGKTITSKMIAQEYKAKGYKILYSHEHNIGNANHFLKEEAPREQLLIILNDFLGQYYTEYKMSEAKTQIASEIGRLFSLVKSRGNVKLLINTRGIIYQEAMQNGKFRSAIENYDNNIREIQMTDLRHEDKLLILYNHLKRAYEYGYLPTEYYMSVVQNREFIKISMHENFIPRIIEYVTGKKFIAGFQADDYVSRIFNVLDNPSIIWEEEYEKLDDIDRICLNTLFSLTNTNVPVGILHACFNNRIKHLNCDTTINHFAKVLGRLSESLVNIEESNGVARIGVMNPSINDFLAGYLPGVEEEIIDIVNHSLYYEQIERLFHYEIAVDTFVLRLKSDEFNKFQTYPRRLFMGFAQEFTPPAYLYILKIMLVYLSESHLNDCGISKTDIQNYVMEIFKTRYIEIESNSRFYFAREFPAIFVKLFRESSGYDWSEIVFNKDYFGVVLNSIIHHDEFWDVIKDVRAKYFSNSDETLFYSDEVVSCITERIGAEIGNETESDILGMITSEIEDNYDDYEDLDDISEIQDAIFDAISTDAVELVEDKIRDKLHEHDIPYISDDHFDTDTILEYDIRVFDMIEQEYGKTACSRSDEFIENFQKPLMEIISLFENAPWVDMGNKG